MNNMLMAVPLFGYHEDILDTHFQFKHSRVKFSAIERAADIELHQRENLPHLRQYYCLSGLGEYFAAAGTGVERGDWGWADADGQPTVAGRADGLRLWDWALEETRRGLCGQV